MSSLHKMLLIVSVACTELVSQTPPDASGLYASGLRHLIDNPADLALAVKELSESANKEYAPAQYALCSLYLHGRGVERNPDTAKTWCERAAQNGSANAAYELGRMSASRGNREEAAHWYSKAAEGGSAEAQRNLGIAYLRGLGVTASAAEAVRWLTRAANQGLKNAQIDLARLYGSGDYGVEKDLRKALMWWTIVGTSLTSKLAGEPARIESQLSANDLNAARQMASEFRVTREAVDDLQYPATGAMPAGIYPLGGVAITDPQPVWKPEPSYTEEARQAGIQGAVLMRIIIDANGNIRDPQVLRGLGHGLDENAIETVLRWKFKPAMKDGKAVAVLANVQVNFRLR